jgi:hypothetical protein
MARADFQGRGIYASDNLLYQFMSTNGDGTGTVNAIGDYSGSAEFYIAPPEGEYYYIKRMLVEIRDTNINNSNNYGALTELTNGVGLEVRDADQNTILDLMAGLPVTSNGSWARTCYDVSVFDLGNGADFVNVRWTFGATGGVIQLDGNKQQRLSILLDDDMTGLEEHYFKVQGWKE